MLECPRMFYVMISSAQLQCFVHYCLVVQCSYLVGVTMLASAQFLGRQNYVSAPGAGSGLANLSQRGEIVSCFLSNAHSIIRLHTLQIIISKQFK